MQRNVAMKEDTANQVGTYILGGTVITSGATGLGWIQIHYSELMVALSIMGLIIGGVSKYYAYQLNKKRLAFDKQQAKKKK